MASLFSPKPATPSGSNQNGFQMPQQDAIEYAETMLRRSGGDAKAAFYLAAQEKGIDLDVFFKQLQGMGDMKSMVFNSMANNPKVKQLMSLFSLVK